MSTSKKQQKRKGKKALPLATALTVAAILPGIGAGIHHSVSYASSSIQTDIPRMYEAFQNISTHPDAMEGFGYGGMSGTCIGPDALSNANRMELVTYHYNTITLENQLKQDHILPSYVPNQ
ncbi:MAG: hypothetical protein LBM60_00630, partial [Clostridium sp.]|nr:hypothetical protein [Clostridium sp.]